MASTSRRNTATDRHAATRPGIDHPSAATPAAVGDAPTANAVPTPPSGTTVDAAGDAAMDAAVDGSSAAPGATGDTAADSVAGVAANAALSVWTTAQAAPSTQRKGLYTPESTAHPAKMLPAVAAHAIAHYTQPGDLVLDPMCGIGTTLVEAVRAGRRAVGVEYENRWVNVARANLDLAASHGHDHDAQVFQGDARALPDVLPSEYRGSAALVVTSPPYGPSTHGQVNVVPGGGVTKYDHRYGNTLDRGNLANLGLHRLLAGFTKVLAGAAELLRPGGHIAITIRPWREHSELIDLPSQILACGLRAGLIPVERCVALLARVGDDGLVARGSFFQRDHIRKQRDAGLPMHLIAHEDVLVFRTLKSLSRSDEPARPEVASARRRGQSATRAPGSQRTRGKGTR